MSESSAPKLPAVPADLTPDWLGSKLGHKIKSLENTRSIWGTGSKLFYTITYDDDDDDKPTTEERPTHVCIKGVFDPNMIEAVPWTVSLAQREADFFSKIAPGLKNMIFPKGLWSATSDKQGLAVMEDLTKTGCTFAPEVAAYPYTTVMNGVEQLASLHADYWGQSQEDHPWIWNNYDPAVKYSSTAWDQVVRLPGRVELPAHIADNTRRNEAVDRFFAERNPRFRTLLHGDPHIGNIYFTADGSIGFLDWSAFHFASCFHDIVYHMTTMLSIKDRRAHEMEILDHYLAALHRLGGPKLDRHHDPEVMVEYRRSFMANLIWLILPDGLQSKERLAVLHERAVAAFDDHKVIDLILSQPKPAAT
ncbi:kinase-like domain-containing protein [Podospora didyma]|uniref:Kinase-like domain-containing protein n=1 Tax=Podospora didyma TaxID=330526 RepID=A0AAE0TZK6_9PEZI|nr:kinase-like domain-containing protein [Podospora didyma]